MDTTDATPVLSLSIAGHGVSNYLFLWPNLFAQGHRATNVAIFCIPLLPLLPILCKRKHTHTHTRLTAIFLGLRRWAGTGKVKPLWILLKQETVSGNGISWAICKSAPRSRQITTPASQHSVFFTGRMPFLPPNQQCQSTNDKQISVRVNGSIHFVNDYFSLCVL